MATPASTRVAPSAGAPRRGRRNLTYREKLAIIQKKEEEPAWTQRVLAMWAKEHFRLETKPTQATISNLLRGKDKLLNTAVPPDFRSARRVRHPELDQRMILWVHQQLQGDAAVTRVSIQNRAMEVAREMQLPADVTFSKGWVSSFMNRHQINLRGGNAAEQENHRHEMLAATADAVQAAVKRTEQVEKEKHEEEMRHEEIEEEEEEVDHAVDVDESEEEQEAQIETTKTVGGDATIQGVKRRRVTTSNGGDLWEAMGTGVSDEGRAAAELLLDWIAVPGSYSRWWLLKNDADKEPLCEEINLFLRSHGLRGMTSVEIRKQLTAFVATFQASHMWLRQARLNYPLGANELTLEQERIKSHVLQMCPHYERLVSVLSPYVNCDESAGGVVQRNTAPAPTPPPPTTVEPSTQVNCSEATEKQVDNASSSNDATLNPAKKSRRQSTESSPDDSVNDETRAQKRRLFELECTRLQSEIETRNIQLVLEKTLARKKLLDAGISPKEVDRIFPL
ncbi:hypothetical protein PRNP1_000098 [Phytophthora ramorum]